MVANLRDLPRRHYTLEEYFALERVGEARYEYWDGDILCMTGGSIQHARISSNVHLLTGPQVKGKNCTAYTGDLGIKTPHLPPYRYPDTSVVCGPPLVEKIEGVEVLVNPIVVIEVLSPGTQSLDRNQKRLAYQDIPTVTEYVLIAQDTPQVTQYVRQGDGWVRQDYGGLTAAVELPSISSRLALSEIYDGIIFN